MMQKHVFYTHGKQPGETFNELFTHQEISTGSTRKHHLSFTMLQLSLETTRPLALCSTKGQPSAPTRAPAHTRLAVEFLARSLTAERDWEPLATVGRGWFSIKSSIKCRILGRSISENPNPMSNEESSARTWAVLEQKSEQEKLLMAYGKYGKKIRIGFLMVFDLGSLAQKWCVLQLHTDTFDQQDPEDCQIPIACWYLQFFWLNPCFG